jgi:hypothetical protein
VKAVGRKLLWAGIPLLAAMAVSLPFSPLSGRVAQSLADWVAGEKAPVSRGMAFWLDVLGWYPAFFLVFLVIRAIPPRWRIRLAAAVALCLLVFGGARLAHYVSDTMTVRSLTPDTLQAYDLLLRAKEFEGPYVGYLVVPSPQAAAFRLIRKDRHAHRIFKTLLRRGTVAGQLYALCGLYYTEYEEFERLIPDYENRTDTVVLFWGCVGEEMPLGRLVKSRSPLAIRYKRGQTMEQGWADWLAAHGKSQNVYPELDIYGGAWPEALSRSPEDPIPRSDVTP